MVVRKLTGEIARRGAEVAGGKAVRCEVGQLWLFASSQERWHAEGQRAQGEENFILRWIHMQEWMFSFRVSSDAKGSGRRRVWQPGFYQPNKLFFSSIPAYTPSSLISIGKVFKK